MNYGLQMSNIYPNAQHKQGRYNVYKVNQTSEKIIKFMSSLSHCLLGSLSGLYHADAPPARRGCFLDRTPYVYHLSARETKWVIPRSCLFCKMGWFRGLDPHATYLITSYRITSYLIVSQITPYLSLALY